MKPTKKNKEQEKKKTVLPATSSLPSSLVCHLTYKCVAMAVILHFQKYKELPENQYQKRRCWNKLEN